MTDHRFPDVPSGYPFPRLELEVLERWREGRIFERSLEKDAPAGDYVIFEGPPTANNVPHVGHVPSRVVKDLFPRYRTMRGHHVARKGGWDTHGLPVEIEVEKRLGFSGKEEIERYGIAEFNRECLESVLTYEREWRAFTERLGYWTDLDNAYLTFSNQYIESVWWALSELWKKDLLGLGYKIQPYCARCGTTLSSHEVAQNYKEADDPSVWVRFPARAGQEIQTVEGDAWTVPDHLDLVAWTTTPWTLLAHVGLVIHPELTYRAVEHPAEPGRLLLFGDDLGQAVPLDMDDPDEPGKRKRVDLRDQPTVARFTGRALENLRYDRPYQVPLGEYEAACAAQGEETTVSDDSGFRVLLGDYVTATDGTGLVHTAPRFGEDDYKTGMRERLPLLDTIDSEGQVRDLPALEAFAGQWFKDADPEITRDLKERGLMLHSDRGVHNYPFCWRCDRPLLYYATESWFVTTTKAKDRLIAANRSIDWHPDHVKDGRFGNWLENMVDWALSRRRYWGTPLPVWQCDQENCSETRVPGSYAELFEAAGLETPDDPYDPDQWNPHRPYIDDIRWPCPACESSGDGGQMVRVEDVIDAWFDSGSMPFAQHHYPFENQDLFDHQFPADVIAEGVDQTRGWFYTLHVLGVLLFDSVAYENCIVLGHINDEDGRKMSKRLGNVVAPMDVIEEAGADALRWYLCVADPETTARFSARLVRESAQKMLMPLWNALSFFTIYANLDDWHPPGSEGGADPVPHGDRPALDRWVLARLDRVTAQVTEHLDAYRIADSARLVEAFVDDLTNWYIRRSRDRFWQSDESAYQTLHEVLVTCSRLVAPFMPFLADEFHRHLVTSQGQGSDSVHLEDWPAPSSASSAESDRTDDQLERAMATVQRIVRLGHAARNAHSLKTRQPLSAVTLVSADDSLPALVEPYGDLLRDELNVQEIRWAEDRSAYVHHTVKPNYKLTGRRFGKRMKEVASLLAAADGDRLAAELEESGSVTLELADGSETLSPEELEVRLEEREGTATQGDRELLVALATELTPELVELGLAREVVNRLSTARKDADLDYADRIRVRYRTGDALESAIDAHRDWIAGETLAVELAPLDDSSDGADLQSAPIDNHDFRFHLERI